MGAPQRPTEGRRGRRGWTTGLACELYDPRGDRWSEDAARVARNLGWPALPPHLRLPDLRRPELKAATVPRSSGGQEPERSEQKRFLFCGSRPPRQP